MSTYMPQQITNDEFISYYDAYSDKIYRYCYYRVYNAEQAKDLVQEVFMRMWRYVAQGNQIDNVQAFLYRIAMNCIINESKKQKRQISLDALQEEGFDVGKDSSDKMIASIDAKKIISVLEDILDESYKDVIILRFLNDLDPKQIAEITGETPNAISVRLHRAIKKLQELLVPYDEK